MWILHICCFFMKNFIQAFDTLSFLSQKSIIASVMLNRLISILKKSYPLFCNFDLALLRLFPFLFKWSKWSKSKIYANRNLLSLSVISLTPVTYKSSLWPAAHCFGSRVLCMRIIVLPKVDHFWPLIHRLC